jgi:sodium/potassium-transporting ATPase subunit alpha
MFIIHFNQGAPEEILKLCNKILIGEQEYPLTDQWKNKVESALQFLGRLGERVIGFADGHLPQEKYNDSYFYTSEKPEFLNTGLRFVGLMSMIDPPRTSVPDAVTKFQRAGVRLVMVTGDHQTTAVAIARAIGLVSKESETLQELSKRKQLAAEQISPARVGVVVITGSELKRMDSTQLNAIIISDKELIFARTTPEQKYMIVEAFQNLGHFVCVCGGMKNLNKVLTIKCYSEI